MQFHVFSSTFLKIFFRIFIQTKQQDDIKTADKKTTRQDDQTTSRWVQKKSIFFSQRCVILEAVLGSFLATSQIHGICAPHRGRVTTHLNCAAGESEILHVIFFNWRGLQLWLYSCSPLLETEKMSCRCHETHGVSQTQLEISFLVQTFMFCWRLYGAFWLCAALFLLTSWKFWVDCWGSVPTPMCK